MNRIWIAASIALAAAGAAASSALPLRSVPRCEVRVSHAGPIVRMDGIMLGPPGAQGQYRLILAKTGPGGDSQTAQGGDYVIGRSGETVVATNELSLDSRDHYRAVMLVDGSTSCSQSGP